MINFSLLDEAFPNDDKAIKKNKKKVNDDNNNEKCKPIQAPPYKIPLNCDNNAKKIMDVNLDENIKKSNYKNDGIKAFDYDEMDAYISVSNLGDNSDKSEEYRTTPFLADYLKNLRDNLDKNISNSNDNYKNIEQFTNIDSKTSIKIDVNLYNLFLFIFLGIVIILLIDQITKLVEIHKA